MMLFKRFIYFIDVVHLPGCTVLEMLPPFEYSGFHPGRWLSAFRKTYEYRVPDTLNGVDTKI